MLILRKEVGFKVSLLSLFLPPAKKTQKQKNSNINYITQGKKLKLKPKNKFSSKFWQKMSINWLEIAQTQRILKKNLKDFDKSKAKKTKFPAFPKPANTRKVAKK